MREFGCLLGLSVFLVSCGGTNETEAEFVGDGSNVVTADLFRHDGQKFSPAQLEVEPEYYVLYYSASW